MASGCVAEVDDFKLLRLETQLDHAQYLGNPQYLAESRIEEILQQRRPCCFQIECRVFQDRTRSHQIELVPSRRDLHDARGVRDAELAQRVGAVVAVVQQQSAVGLDDVEEIGAVSHQQPDNAPQRTKGVVSLDLPRLQPSGFVK